MDISRFDIQSPKRSIKLLNEWERYFPYYAGFPEVFAERLLASANLPVTGCVLDPWNGSGTTTYAASRLGISSIGVDINPVMALVARARALPASEADSLTPLGREILSRARRDESTCSSDDPLSHWFGDRTCSWIRSVERSSREILLGGLSSNEGHANFDKISSIAATYYVVLFSICLDLAKPFRASNPTWIRKRKSDQSRIGRPATSLDRQFERTLDEMASVLQGFCRNPTERASIEIRMGDTTNALGLDSRVDFILTSPPYCTRIDYSAATRIQLAVLFPLMRASPRELSRCMLGSVHAPKNPIETSESWGPTCLTFLRNVAQHKSKASNGYYFKTHLDYFSKLYLSLNSIAKSLKNGGAAVFVVQDSFYKELHNDLPKIVAEIAEAHGLKLERQEDFPLRTTAAAKHRHRRNYREATGATESVLCFSKNGKESEAP